MTIKLTKKDLKSVLKECLREILLEEGVIVKEAVSRGTRKTLREESEDEQPSARSNIVKQAQASGINPLLLERINNVVGNSDGDPAKSMYEKIFFDTAMTTLQSQESAGHSVLHGGGSYSTPAAAAAALSLTEVVDRSMPTPYTTAAQPLASKDQLKDMAPAGDTKLWAKIAFAKK